jgi:hypothetical protein
VVIIPDFFSKLDIYNRYVPSQSGHTRTLRLGIDQLSFKLNNEICMGCMLSLHRNRLRIRRSKFESRKGLRF